MRFLDRYGAAELEPRPVLWEDLDSLSEEALVALLDDLQLAVSNGYFGLAAQISDQIRSCARDVVRVLPEIEVRLLVEQMKRLFYMGFRVGPRKIADRILSMLPSLEGRLKQDELDFLEFECIGYRAWLEGDVQELGGYIGECEGILRRFAGSVDQAAVLGGFLDGTRGRFHALVGDRTSTKEAFDRGIGTLKTGGLSRSLAHLEVYYAEHLALLEDWTGSAEVAVSFLKRALGSGFKSHLVLRAVLLLLQSPEEVLSGAERRQFAFRCWLLVHAMGVSQLGPAFPLLEQGLREAGEELARAPASLLFEADLQSELLRWMLGLTWKQTELLLAGYYEAEGFQVEFLPKDEVALDMLATRGRAENSEVVGIQVKHHTSRPLYKGKVPDEISFEESKAHIRTLGGRLLPARFHWHCTRGMHSKARELLERRLRNAFGEAVRLYCTDIHELAGKLLTSPEQLPRIVLGVEVRSTGL